MTTQKENQTENAAKQNQTRIMELEQPELPKATQKMLSMAYENESNIAYSAKALELDLKRGIQRLTDCLQYLQEGTTGLLGACGVMQGLNHDIDVEITKIQSGIKSRAFYRDTIK